MDDRRRRLRSRRAAVRDGAVVRNVDLDEEGLESLIQLQEKLHATMGRKRAKGAIGIHDLTMMKGNPATEGSPTIEYVGVEPDGDRFVPSIPTRS